MIGIWKCYLIMFFMFNPLLLCSFRALIIVDEKLVSVGADGYLTLSSYPPKWVMRVPPIIPLPRSAVCAKKKLLLLR